MADFGQNRLWPKPTLAKTDFGQNEFDLLCVVLCCVLSVWRGCCFTVSEWGFMCGCWFQGLVWTALLGTVLPRDRPSPGPPFPWTALPLDRPSPGPPFPWTALPLDRPKFSLFFSLSRRKIRSFLPSLGVFSLNFGGVFEGRDPQMCTFGLSGCRVEPRRLGGRWGFTRQSENSKRAHLSVPALQTPPKFHEKTPRERRKEQNFVAGQGKKARNFGPPTLRGSTFRGSTLLGSTLLGSTLRAPTLRAPTFSGFGPPPFGLPPFGPPPFGPPLGLAPGLHEENQTIKNHNKNNLKKSKQSTRKIQTIKNHKKNN